LDRVLSAARPGARDDTCGIVECNLTLHADVSAGAFPKSHSAQFSGIGGKEWIVTLSRLRIIFPVLLVLATAAVVWKVYAESQTPDFSVPARSLIQHIGARYHDTHPVVLEIQRNHTDPPPHDPMYFIHLAGRFRRGKAQADELYIVALADRYYISGITGYTGTGKHRHIVWTDCRKPCTKQGPLNLSIG
jgi:hypothetical protein